MAAYQTLNRCMLSLYLFIYFNEMFLLRVGLLFKKIAFYLSHGYKIK